MNTEPTIFVFVDFENVQDVDLTLAQDKPVHVTLLIGAKQTKLPTKLSLQLNTFAAQVRPVEVGGSGRNALDLTLAMYLGREIERHPQASFTIVSRDQDFDPMIAHLNSTGVRVERVPSFVAVSAFSPARKHTRAPRIARASAAKPIGRPAPVAPAPRSTVPAHASLERRWESVSERLSQPENRNRPRTRERLLAYLETSAGGSKQDAANLLNRLQQAQVLTIGSDNRVQYRAQ